MSRARAGGRLRRASKALCGVLLLAFIVMQGRAVAAERFRPFKMPTPEGVQTSLSDVLGKATLVVFFYPTCPYCRAAFPEMLKLYEKFKGQGLSMVWINVVPGQDGLVSDWRAWHGQTVSVLLGGSSVQDDYNLVMTPTYYLLDSQGAVLSRREGYRAGDEKALEQEMQRAIGAAR